jgi:hypothetical protein
MTRRTQHLTKTPSNVATGDFWNLLQVFQNTYIPNCERLGSADIPSGVNS